MKKRLRIVITVALMLTLSFTLFACNTNESDDNGTNNGAVSGGDQNGGENGDAPEIANIETEIVEIDGKKYNRFTFSFTDGTQKVVDVEITEDEEEEKPDPQFKLIDGVLHVSYDGGLSWEKVEEDGGEEAPPETGEGDVTPPEAGDGEVADTQKFEDYDVVGSITNGYGGANGIVCLMTDNDSGDFETIVRVDEMFRKYGLVGGLGTVVKNLYLDGERTTLRTADVAKWNEFLDTGRWKIISHSMTHTKYASGSGETFAIDDDRIYEEIVESGELLREIFPDQRVLTYIMTGNASSVGVEDWSLREREKELIEQYYIGGRFGQNGNPVAIDKLDFSALPYETIYTSSLQNSISKVNACADQGKFYIVFNHYVIEEETLPILGQSSWTSLETMDALCAAVAKRQNDGSLWCAHLEDAVMYMREKNTATLEVSLVDGVIKILLTDEMDDEIFNHDLTVRVNLPLGTKAVKLVQGERVSFVATKTDADGTYAFLNIRPDGGEAQVYPAELEDVPTELAQEPPKTPSLFEDKGEILTFEDGSPVTDSARLIWADIGVEAFVTKKDERGVVCISKTVNTPEHPRLCFGTTLKNPEANATVFEAELFIEHTSGRGNVQILLMKDTAVSAIRTTLSIEGATKGILFNSFDATGGSQSATTTAKAGEWFSIRIEYYEGDKDTVKTKVFVNNVFVTESDLYYHSNTDYVVPAEDSEMVMISPANYFIGKVYVDNLSYRQVVKEYEAEKLPQEEPTEEHSFDDVVSEMGVSIKYSAKNPDAATVTQETEGNNNYLCYSKIRTDEQPYLDFLNTVSNSEAAAYVFKTRMKLDYTSGSKQVYIAFMCGSINNFLYNCYFDINSTGGLDFYDFNTGSVIRSPKNATTAKEGEWFDLRIEFYDGTRDTVRIKTYVNDILVYESSNYYPAYKEGETMYGAADITAVRVMGAWGYVGDICLDNLSTKQTKE